MSENILKLPSTYYFDLLLKNVSGTSQAADETPKFWVYKNADSTGVTAALSAVSMIPRTAFVGHYYGTFVASTGNAFATGNYYNILTSGKVNSLTQFQSVATLYTQNNTSDDLASGVVNQYYADINYNMDDVNLRDEFTVCWFKNAVPYSGFTSPTIRIVKRSDGANFLVSTAMSGIGSPVVAARYDTSGTSNRLLEGEAYLVQTNATIDGTARTWFRLVSRDVRIT